MKIRPKKTERHNLCGSEKRTEAKVEKDGGKSIEKTEQMTCNCRGVLAEIWSKLITMILNIERR